MDTVVAAEFHPLERNQIVTCGKGHISFWTLDAGGTLYKRNGIFETTRDRPKYVTCLAFTQNGDVLSGDSNGSVAIWGRGEYLFCAPLALWAYWLRRFCVTGQARTTSPR